MGSHQGTNIRQYSEEKTWLSTHPFTSQRVCHSQCCFDILPAVPIVPAPFWGGHFWIPKHAFKPCTHTKMHDNPNEPRTPGGKCVNNNKLLRLKQSRRCRTVHVTKLETLIARNPSIAAKSSHTLPNLLPSDFLKTLFTHEQALIEPISLNSHANWHPLET